MTAVLLVSVYLFALACFLGLDVLGKVPPNLYALVVAGVAGLTGVAALAALGVADQTSSQTAWRLTLAGIALSAAAAGAGLVAVMRLSRGFVRRGKRREAGS